MHFLVLMSFTVLVFTGMPLKYKDADWARWVMDLFGGATAAGLYHRVAAIVTWSTSMLEFAYIGRHGAAAPGKALRGPTR